MAMQRDYLMRYIQQFIEAIQRSMVRVEDQEDPEGAAEMLDEAIGNAADMDSALLLGFAPESMASILQVSGTDPRLVEYIARSLALSSSYHGRAGDASLELLRMEQAQALAAAYGIDLDIPWEELFEGEEVPGGFLDD